MSTPYTGDPADNENLTGDSTNNIFYGREGDDTLSGLAGNDRLYGGANNDTLYGGEDNDSLYGDEGCDTLYGGTGEDRLYADTPDDTGIDTLYGGEDNDRLYLSSAAEGYGGIGNDTFYGGQGATALFGGDGIDTLDLTLFGDDIGKTATVMLAGGALSGSLFGNGQMGGFEKFETRQGLTELVVVGGDEDNEIRARLEDGGVATIEGGGGNDTLTELFGGVDDIFTMYGGIGDDSIYGGYEQRGGADNDLLQGGVLVYGGIGSDSIIGDDVGSTLFGGEGDDTIEGRNDNDEISGGKNADYLNGGWGSDTIFGGKGGDTIYGGAELSSSESVDSLFGGDGNDIIVADTNAGGRLDVLFGGEGNDTLSEGSSSFGGEGEDTISGAQEAYGGDDNDTLIGGGTMFGGDGKDTFSGTSSSVSYGGKGNDTFSVGSNSSGSFTAYVYGGEGRDSIDAGSGWDILYGGENNDSIDGGGGTDTLFGGDGNDYLDANGASSNAQDYHNSLYGGEGNDTLLGQNTDDILDGGDGKDLFKLSLSPFAKASTLHIKGGEGFDKVDLSSVTGSFTILVDLEDSKITFKNPFVADKVVSFSGIEKFIGNSTIQYTGLDLKAPDVDRVGNSDHDGLDGINSRLLKKGSTITFSGELGDGDSEDYFAFYAEKSGTASVTSLLGGYDNSEVFSSISVKKGLNTIKVAELGTLSPQFYDYEVKIELEGKATVRNTEVNRFLNDNFTGWTKQLTVDNNKIGAELFEVIFKHMGSAAEVTDLFNGIAKELGFVGDLIDIGTKIDVIQAAYNSGGPDAVKEGQRAAFVEIMDFLAGAAATGAGGFTGSLLGAFAGPIGVGAGAILGSLVSGVVYGRTLSDTIKNDAGERFDLLYFIQTEGPGTFANENSDKSNASLPDFSALVFDEDWYADSHPDAVDAVQSGKYPSYFAYYIAVGLKAGHLANENGAALDNTDLAIKVNKYDGALFETTGLFEEDLGDYAGDGSSKLEKQVAARINRVRDEDAVFDAKLSAVANRIAVDWVVNQADELGDASYSGGSGDWVRILSNGEHFWEALPLKFGDPTLFGNSQVFGVSTSSGSAKKIVKKLLSDNSPKDEIKSEDTLSFGVAEYGGLWVVVVFDDVLSGNPIVTDNSTQIIRDAGSAEADFVEAGLGRIIADLFEGDDAAYGGDKSDSISGGDGGDALFGGQGGDTLRGDEGSDTLDGGKGTDRLFGGDGIDTLNGGKGNDVLKGGAGKDVFVFQNGFGTDRIADFNATSNAEVIDLSAVTAIRNFTDLNNNHMKKKGDDVVITDGDNTLTLTDVNLSDLGKGDFLF